MVEEIAAVVTQAAPPPPPPVAIQMPKDISADETVVIPPAMQDLQTQIDIMAAQIKQLNKKIISMDQSLEGALKHAPANANLPPMMEMPTNPQDFTQKLMKLAEHVIVLEKDMAKLKKHENTPMPL